jgi:hypothetical protein
MSVQDAPVLHEKLHAKRPSSAERIETPKQPPQVPERGSKENEQPPKEPFALSALQESYGGEWADDLALTIRHALDDDYRHGEE